MTFSAKYKTGKTNVVVDALSRKHNLLAILGAGALGFEMIKDFYPEDSDFKDIYASCLEGSQGILALTKGSYLREIDFVFLRPI